MTQMRRQMFRRDLKKDRYKILSMLTNVTSRKTIDTIPLHIPKIFSKEATLSYPKFQKMPKMFKQELSGVEIFSNNITVQMRVSGFHMRKISN